MNYEFYRLMHFTGIFMTLTALGGIAVHMINGGSKQEFPGRKWVAVMHGVGLLLALTGGFGMLARLYGGMETPPWAIIKLVIWVLLGALPAPMYKMKSAARALYVAALVLAVAAGAAAYFKPFSDAGAEVIEQGEADGGLDSDDTNPGGASAPDGPEEYEDEDPNLSGQTDGAATARPKDK